MAAGVARGGIVDVVRWVRGWIAVLLASAAAASGGALACVLELEHRVACGDGFVDPDAGEQCDPADPSSYEGACLANGFGGGVGDCDATECTIIADAQQCSYCGDDEIAPPDGTDGSGTGDGEECDTSEFGAETCPNGGALVCTDCNIDKSGCLPYCGDAQLLGDEECGEPPGGVTIEPPCAGIASSVPGIPYGSGIARCAQCRWDRTECSYCGNGTRDDALSLYEGGPISPEEWCDADQFDHVKLAELYGSACERLHPGSRPNVRCAPGCYDFIEPTLDEPQCCVRSGATCPGPEASFECCFAHEHPDDPEPCEEYSKHEPLFCR